MPKELNDKQDRFCREYLVDYNATQAAIRSGYSKKTAGQIGEQLLKKLEIQDRIKELSKHTLKKLEISKERTFLEIARLAFSDLRKYFDEDGNLKPVHELDDDAAAALASLETDELFSPGEAKKVQIGLTRKIKTYDKTKALEMLAKHYNIYDDAPKINNTIHIGYGKEQ